MHITTAYSHYHNKGRLDKAGETAAAVCVENLSKWAEAVEEINTWPEYQPQPLHSLSYQAKRMGIEKLFFKDESKRFGTSLGSFKALGAPYAVFKILADEVFSKTGIMPTSVELRMGKYKDITQHVTVCVATDGNQGRGLAFGANIFGCRCVDYIHNHVSTGRADRMRDLGAIVIRIDGEYEVSVERAKEDARMNGWHFVSSTSWSDFDTGIPQNVMNAYMVVVEEALQMVPAMEDITHVFVCGGVGSIAAAVFLGFFTRYSQNPPRFVVVEPTEADCLYQSPKKGRMCLSEGSLRTLMAGLACRGPSPVAWEILTWFASDFVAVPDEVAVEGMKELASGHGGDIPVVCGESSAANMGVMVQAANDESLREKLGLNGNSQVILFGLEGATDPAIYRMLVEKSPEQVFEAQERFSKAQCGS
ncbi:tryptophan synthase beta subunit-like PLP-dependent enzyme [Thelonectria olida]|uniref:Tryptophan synthase beta subunit-like PLP-dependent enzyme n=1 Tax=Thelonectria olida TaxID=1576542 RepID=A0A9P8VXQ9_9HYPO|nr:tryptophan synthase beta subunit-like PLP-dependent enzyme [Thelonectria olida]